MRILILIATAALLVACRVALRSAGERSNGAFVKRTVAVDGATYLYQVFVPRAGSGDRPPVILFLHGGGERGIDGERQTRVGLGPVVRARAASFPAVVVFPQAPRESLWQGPPARAALAALGAAIEEFGGDPDRVYLTGISMGGYGTFELALREPGRFAALVAVCGGLRAPSDHLGPFVEAIPPGERDAYAFAAARLSSVPLWLFHGAADDKVPVAESRLLASAFGKAGAQVRYTEYPGVGHNSWDRAYREPGLWEWLFAQRRKG